MGEALVLDASAALALLLGEPDGRLVREQLERQVDEPVLVLDLFWLEVVNVLVHRHHWDADAVVEAVRELDELGPETVVLDRPLLLASLDLAVAHGLTANDAAHLALTEAQDARLLTLDDELIQAAGARSAIRPQPGTHEDRARYGTTPARPDWVRHGRFLADLRRAAGS